LLLLFSKRSAFFFTKDNQKTVVHHPGTMIDTAAFAVTEAEALAAIRGWTGPMIVDFDETLCLLNSTEAFLDGAMPAVLAAILLRLVDLCAPWRWRGGAVTRDVWRLRAVLWLCPGAMRRWRAGCRHLAEQVNVPLLAALRARGAPFIVASAGFAPLIRPLLDSMGCADVPLIACAVAPGDRQRGKLAAIEAAIGAEALAAAMVVTDSADDAAVLAACARPCLTTWRGARFRRALRRVYLPGDYLVHVKRPLQAGAFRRLMTDDLGLWLLMAAPGLDPRALAGVAALFLSLWSVYEIGYRENDVCALRLEADPVVSPQGAAFDTAWFEPKAWIAATLLGGLAIFALRPADFAATAGAWAATLAALRAVYWWYNRLDKRTRVWVYLLLQAFRTLGVAVGLPVGALGMMAGVAQICARWQEYFWYRFAPREGGFRWTDTPLRLIQLLFFLLCLSALARAGVDVWTWRTAALLAWSAILARKDIRATIGAAHRLNAAAQKGSRDEDHGDQGLADRPALQGRPL
jgi:hypothetical protein